MERLQTERAGAGAPPQRAPAREPAARLALPQRSFAAQRRIVEIDALRFIAALMVLLFHWAYRGGVTQDFTSFTCAPLMPLAQYGYLGVDLFFMVSGFVILMSANGRGLFQFFRSRAMRLYPAFWTCCTLTAAGAWLFNDPHFQVGARAYLWNMTLAASYLPFHVPPVDGVYWSLFCEIRFYVLVALVLSLGLLPRLESLLWGWLTAAALLHVFPHPARLQPWLQVDYAGLFAGGACCFLIHSRGLTRSRLALLAASFVLALRRVLQEVELQERAYHGHPSLLVASALLTAFFAIMLVIAINGVPLLRWRHAATAGALTYPLYLLHQNLGYMAFNRWGGAMPQGALLLSVLAAALLASWVISRFVEPALQRPIKALLTIRMAPAVALSSS